jgi:hypothetical protein
MPARYSHVTLTVRNGNAPTRQPHHRSPGQQVSPDPLISHYSVDGEISRMAMSEKPGGRSRTKASHSAHSSTTEVRSQMHDTTMPAAGREHCTGATA